MLAAQPATAAISAKGVALEWRNATLLFTDTDSRHRASEAQPLSLASALALGSIEKADLARQSGAFSGIGGCPEWA